MGISFRRSIQPDTSRCRVKRHTMAALSAVRAHRGTDRSNPLSSSGESANHGFLNCLGVIAVYDRQSCDAVAPPPPAAAVPRRISTGPERRDLAAEGGREKERRCALR